MNDTSFIPVVLGTARKGRSSEQVARYLTTMLEARKDVETELIDVGLHSYHRTTPPWGEGGANKEPTPWKKAADRASAFILVVPEYNRGYPGELKMLLDSLHDSYDKKPVLVCGVSSGIFGGRALVEHMRPVLTELKMVPVRGGLYIGKIREFFDEEGNPVDSEFTKRVQSKLEELLRLAHALKVLRI